MKPASARRHLVPVSLALLACVLPARAEVWIVAGGFFPSPGADFGQIYQAVAAAADGDTLLVRDGTYKPFSITGKSLTVIADGADVFVDGVSGGIGTSTILVRDLQASQEVLVRGLRTNFGLDVSNCAGVVWIDEVSCLGSQSPCASGKAPGARVTASTQVTFTRCAFEGEIADFDINFFSGAGSAGLQATSSTVQLFDCTIVGGAGPSWSQISAPPGPGAPGLRLESSTVTLVGCTVEGGAGGRAEGNLCAVIHAPGGPGVEFVGTGSTIRSAESTAVGGVLSLAPLCPDMSGPQGPAISGAGTIVALPGFARHLRANSPVRGGETLSFELAGQPGEVPVVVVSLEHQPLPLFNSTLLVELPATEVFVLPPLPASGEGALGIPVPNVGAAVGSMTFYAQAAFVDATFRLWLGAGTTVVLLDSAL